MNTARKLVGSLVLAAAVCAGCARHDHAPSAAARGLTPEPTPSTAPAPWEPVDKQFTGCAGS
jgi:hypothetical protein